MQFDTQSLWVYLYFPQLQLNLLEQQLAVLGEQQAKACIIYDPTLNQVIQLNKHAHKVGIKKGLGLASASMLSPQLLLKEYQPSLETNAINELANQLYAITSDIVIDAPNGLYLRAQNMLRLYGGLNEYWHIVQQVLTNCGYEYFYASAYSVNVAKLIAKHHQCFMSDDEEQIRLQVSNCSLHLSDIDKKDIEKLKRIGIKYIKPLFEQPLEQLASRVSRSSLRVISELRGESATKLIFYSPAETYSDYKELLYDIAWLDQLLPIINERLRHFEQFLLVRNALTLTIDITLFLRDNSPVIVPLSSALAIYKRTDWFAIIELAFSNITIGSPAFAISIACQKLEVADAHYQDLFNDKAAHVAHLTLLSRLKAKLGSDKVKQLSYHNDFRPEKTTHSVTQNSSCSPSFSTPLFLDRPGFLLPLPMLLVQKVNLINGPERIASGWWENDAIERDYYIGKNTLGQHLWLFKTPKNEWFIHGYFI